jgi:hypothetical protein
MSDLTIKQQVEQSRNPQEALLVIAEALDGITSLLISDLATGPRDEWGEWQPQTQAQATVTEDEDGNVTVDIKPPSAEKKIERFEFAKQKLKLHECYDEENILEAYSKGGPLWLYTSDRDFVVKLPEELKRAMIEDLEELSPDEAALMARDLLKQDSEPPALGLIE